MQKKERMANLEVLRCVAMMMVVVLHYLGKGGLLPDLTAPLSAQDTVAWLLEAFCIVAVNVYMMISGYFLCESSFKLSRLLTLWVQLWLYSVGIGVLAEPVSNLLFAGEDNSLLIRLTMAGALAVVFFSLSTVTNAVLQGLNRLDVPVRHAFLSLAVHIILVEVFLMIFHMGIFSVVFANILFAFMMCLLNGRSIARYAGYRQEYKKTVILPFVCSLLMGAAAWSIYKGLVFLCPALLSGGRLGMAVLVFPPVAVSMAVYGVLLVKLKAIDEKELKEMPMGTRLVRLCKRVRLM